jgi:hypothetical protein
MGMKYYNNQIRSIEMRFDSTVSGQVFLVKENTDYKKTMTLI